MRVILGLPDVGSLNLNQAERKVLIEVYQSTINEMKERILNLANFYDTFRIIYGKWKHGLTFQSGSENLNTEFDNSFNILLKYGFDNPFVIEFIFLSNSTYLLLSDITTFDIRGSCRVISFL